MFSFNLHIPNARTPSFLFYGIATSFLLVFRMCYDFRIAYFTVYAIFYASSTKQPPGSAPGGCFCCENLLQKSVHDLILGLFFGQAKGHQLDELFTGNLADGGFVDQAGVHTVGGQGRAGND